MSRELGGRGLNSVENEYKNTKIKAAVKLGPGSNPGFDSIYGLSLLIVLSPFFPSPQKRTFPNSISTRNQVDEEPLCGCATSKSLFIYLFIYLFIIYLLLKLNHGSHKLQPSRCMRMSMQPPSGTSHYSPTQLM